MAKNLLFKIKISCWNSWYLIFKLIRDTWKITTDWNSILINKKQTIVNAFDVIEKSFQDSPLSFTKSQSGQGCCEWICECRRIAYTKWDYGTAEHELQLTEGSRKRSETDHKTKNNGNYIKGL